LPGNCRLITQLSLEVINGDGNSQSLPCGLAKNKSFESQTTDQDEKQKDDISKLGRRNTPILVSRLKVREPHFPCMHWARAEVVMALDFL
jgi:hypothetical protein